MLTEGGEGSLLERHQAVRVSQHVCHSIPSPAGSSRRDDTGSSPAACWNHSAHDDSWKSSALLRNMMATCAALIYFLNSCSESYASATVGTLQLPQHMALHK